MSHFVLSNYHYLTLVSLLTYSFVCVFTYLMYHPNPSHWNRRLMIVKILFHFLIFICSGQVLILCKPWGKKDNKGEIMKGKVNKDRASFLLKI